MKKFWLLIFLFTGTIQSGFSQLNLKGTVWDLPELQAVPDYKVLEQDSVMGIIYQGLPHKNLPKSVFAYYTMLRLLCGDCSKDVLMTACRATFPLPVFLQVEGWGGMTILKSMQGPLESCFSAGL